MPDQIDDECHNSGGDGCPHCQQREEQARQGRHLLQARGQPMTPSLGVGEDRPGACPTRCREADLRESPGPRPLRPRSESCPSAGSSVSRSRTLPLERPRSQRLAGDARLHNDPVTVGLKNRSVPQWHSVRPSYGEPEIASFVKVAHVNRLPKAELNGRRPRFEDCAVRGELIGNLGCLGEGCADGHKRGGETPQGTEWNYGWRHGTDGDCITVAGLVVEDTAGTNGPPV